MSLSEYIALDLLLNENTSKSTFVSTLIKQFIVKHTIYTLTIRTNEHVELSITAVNADAASSRRGCFWFLQLRHSFVIWFTFKILSKDIDIAKDGQICIFCHEILTNKCLSQLDAKHLLRTLIFAQTV